MTGHSVRVGLGVSPREESGEVGVGGGDSLDGFQMVMGGLSHSFRSLRNSASVSASLSLLVIDVVLQEVVDSCTLLLDVE